MVADKGYHSGPVLTKLHGQEVRSYIPEPDRGRRKWQGEGKAEAQKRTYENRRRVRGERNKRLQKLRSELTERSFAHLYETGGMRRVHLRGRDNILKRLLVHGAAFNLSLIRRKTLGVGKPRRLQGLCLELPTRFARVFYGSGRNCRQERGNLATLRRKAHHSALRSAFVRRNSSDAPSSRSSRGMKKSDYCHRLLVLLGHQICSIH